MANYKDLQINSELIPIKLKEYADGGAVTISRKNTATHYAFLKDGKKVLLIVHVKNSGKVTLQPSGADMPAAEQAAQFIADGCHSIKIKDFNLTLKGYTAGKFSLLVDYLVEECGASIIDHREDDGKISRRVQGRQGDKLMCTLYANGTLLVQGAPVVLAWELLTFLVEDDKITEAEMLGYLGDVFGTKATPQEAQEVCVRECASAYAFAGSDLKKLLSTAISMHGMPIMVEDYSVISFPALKALELFMKAIVLKACDERWNDFSDKFDKVAQAPLTYKLQSDTRRLLSCQKTCDALEACYPHYRAHRHGTFHADGLDGGTRILENRVQALDISQKALALIDYYSRELLEKP
ncbi:RNase LS family HEPN domain-containing protein [Desulfocurvibacter africanus]|uniref:RNase LS family HEPN domain-containing protein n=1 Tax=Desulfocurvibacter africanus TaxID=873 RepID=UPI0004200652|nr:RNase LS family HEPN domain-containing protein [Desulfocurvibacter africanus]